MTYLVLAIILLIVVALSISPITSGVTKFEVDRRKKRQPVISLDSLRLEQNPNLDRLMSLKISFLLIFLAISLNQLVGWAWALAIGLVVIIVSWPLSRTRLVNRPIGWLYRKFEKSLLVQTGKLTRAVPWLFQGEAWWQSSKGQQIFSKEELFELLDKSPSALQRNQLILVKNALSFHEKPVRQIMKPIDDLVSVAKDELLGPVALSDLHKSGQDFVPVTDGDKGVIGIIRLRDFLIVDGTVNSQTARQAMAKDVIFADKSDKISQLLDKLLSSQQQIAMVIGPDRQAIGMVTLRDIIAQLVE